jgi:hypothetical protein
MRMRVPGGLAALCVAGCLAGAPSAAPVTLRFRPAPGAAYRYALEQRITMRPDSGTLLPTRNVVVRAHLTQQIGAPGADGIPVTSTVDSVALDSAGLPAAMRDAMAERLRGLRIRTVLDQRMRPVRQDVLNGEDADVASLAVLEQGARGLAFPLPEGPVRVGDTWTVAVPVPTAQVLPAMPRPLEASTTITVRDVRIAGSDTTVVLGVAARIPETAVTVELSMRQSEVRVSGALAGDQEFSVPRGTVVRTSLAWEVRLEMTLGIPDDPPVGLILDQRLSLRMLEGP